MAEILKPLSGYDIKTFRSNKVSKKNEDGTITSPTGAPEVRKSDTVSISGTSRDFQVAKEAAMSAPDNRQEKVEELKKAINDGTYKVDADKIAEKMIGSIVQEII